jgi:RHS repeat-associated protein
MEQRCWSHLFFHPAGIGVALPPSCHSNRHGRALAGDHAPDAAELHRCGSTRKRCFTGGASHDASGLLYRRNRYYNPQTGRFTQEGTRSASGAG